LNSHHLTEFSNSELYLFGGLPSFITLNAKTNRFLVYTDDETTVGGYQIVLVKNIDGGRLFASFELKVIID
jgi:hypothetical protein